MYIENCPSYICGGSDTPLLIYYATVMALIIIPYVALSMDFYIKKKADLSSILSKTIFFALAIIGYFLYLAVLFYSCINAEIEILNYIGVVAYGLFMTSVFMLPVALTIALCFFMVKRLRLLIKA